MHSYILHQYAPLTFVHVRCITILAWISHYLLCNHLPAEHKIKSCYYPAKKLFTSRFGSLCTNVYASYNVAIIRETFFAGMAMYRDNRWSYVLPTLYLVMIVLDFLRTTKWVQNNNMTFQNVSWGRTFLHKCFISHAW